MHLSALWRYPVKSMTGERIAAAELRPDGIAGDRIVQVLDDSGAVLTARTHARLLALRADLDDNGEARVEGLPWTSVGAADKVLWAAGPGATLAAVDGARRFDILPLLVATDGAIEAFGEDGRRLRLNIVIGGVDGLAERTWEGKLLRIGEVLIGVHSLRDRCIVTTYDPDTLEQRVDVLRDIKRQFDGKLALNCWVLRAGRLRVDDHVEVLDAAGAGNNVPAPMLGRLVR